MFGFCRKLRYAPTKNYPQTDRQVRKTFAGATWIMWFENWAVYAKSSQDFINVASIRLCSSVITVRSLLGRCYSSWVNRHVSTWACELNVYWILSELLSHHHLWRSRPIHTLESRSFSRSAPSSSKILISCWPQPGTGHVRSSLQKSLTSCNHQVPLRNTSCILTALTIITINHKIYI